MADPTPYAPDYSFSGYQSTNPNRPLPGPRVDDELFNIAETTTSIIECLSDVRRSDGKLPNGIVTRESLAGGFYVGLDPATPWATATEYAVDAVVFEGTSLYLSLVEHVSGDFDDDLAADKWQLLATYVIETGSFVQVDVAQSFTDEQKEQGRANLGLDDLTPPDGSVSNVSVATPADQTLGISTDKLTLPALSGGGVALSVTTMFRRETYARQFGAVADGTDQRANLQAALTYAETNGFRLLLDGGQYRIGTNPGNSSYGLYSTYPCALIGHSGTRTAIDGVVGFPNTSALIRVDPVGVVDGAVYSDVYFGDFSNGTRRGKEALYVLTGTAGSNLSEPRFDHLSFGRSGVSGARSILHINDVGLNTNGGLTTARFDDCAFQDPVQLEGSGDQIQIIGCRFQTGGSGSPGLVVDLINTGGAGGQAGGFQVLGCTFLCEYGAIQIDSSASTYLFFNQFEGIATPGSNNSLIDINGSSSTCLSTHVQFNTITSFAATNNVANLRLANCSGGSVDNNDFRISSAMAGLADIRVISGSNGISIGAGNKASGSGLGLLVDGGTGTVDQTRAAWSAAGLGTPYTGSWDAGNTGQEVLTARRLLALEQACRKYGIVV